MKARFFTIIIIALLLIALVTGEQIFVRQTIDYMQAEASTIKQEILTSENLDNQNLIDKINSLDEIWTRKEEILCLIVNHKDMEKVGEQIDKLKTLITQNKKLEAEKEVNLLIYFIDGYEHFVSITFQNLL